MSDYWLSEQLELAKNEVESWPEWMKRENNNFSNILIESKNVDDINSESESNKESLSEEKSE